MAKNCVSELFCARRCCTSLTNWSNWTIWRASTQRTRQLLSAIQIWIFTPDRPTYYWAISSTHSLPCWNQPSCRCRHIYMSERHPLRASRKAQSTLHSPAFSTSSSPSSSYGLMWFTFYACDSYGCFFAAAAPSQRETLVESREIKELRRKSLVLELCFSVHFVWLCVCVSTSTNVNINAQNSQMTPQ